MFPSGKAGASSSIEYEPEETAGSRVFYQGWCCGGEGNLRYDNQSRKVKTLK